MAPRKKSRRQDAQLGFEALAIEGALLSPEWLAKAAQLEAAAQGEADYRTPKGLNLRDEIGRYWRMAQALWGEFQSGQHGGSDATRVSERFVTQLLTSCFGFTSLNPVPPQLIEDRTYPIGFAALEGRVPVIVAAAGSGLDTACTGFGDGNRKRSAFGLAQEYLNAAEGSLWGLVCDGTTLRIVRDNASMTRPAWIEADLASIFTEPRYADFALLWLLAHETRFGKPGQPVTECTLEAWRNAGREEGTRAREHLRLGVEEALLALGQGFLACPDNGALRQALYDGKLTPKDYFNQLLRLVYRLIFALTVEERGVLHPEGSEAKARQLYAEGYSLKRLRERSVRRSAHDKYTDLWEATKIVFRGLATGEHRLALPALGGLFGAGQCPDLDGSRLQNRHLLLATFKLGWLREAAGLSRVNWRDMGPEELGSVYESLLELVPQVANDGKQFQFAQGGETKGNARKTSGSYYTPDSLVQVLLDSALEPVVQRAITEHPENPVEALLSLAVVDPACGSGHFLLAAARRIALHVARLQCSGTPSPSEFRRAVRQVVGRCIYGVDLNPMAVELCRVSLWMEAVEPGLPLTFLSSHIQHGNSLLGTTPDLMTKGVPDVAWEPIEGDDRKTASELKKRNKASAGGQRSLESLWAKPAQTESLAVAKAVRELEAASDADLAQLSQKESKWDQILQSPEYQHEKFVADAWCAAFVWPKQPGDLSATAPTNDLWRQLRDKRGNPPPLTLKTVNDLADQYEFFHWHQRFPHIFSKGGFDVVLGNPPWERVKLQEQEFFASRDEEIAKAPNASARKKLIAALQQSEIKATLYREWIAASRQAEGESHIVRNSGRFPLCGKGDVNTYSVFAEHNRSVLQKAGRAGFIVPTGIATDETTKEFFSSLVEGRSLISLFDFQTGPELFSAIGHARFKLSLVTVGICDGSPELAFYLRSTADLASPDRRFRMDSKELQLLNPNTRTCPTFRTRRDADLNIVIYKNVGILWDEALSTGNTWDLRFSTMLHMAGDSDLFIPDNNSGLHPSNQYANQSQLNEQRIVPLLEAKMLHQYDHRFGDYSDRSADSENTALPDVPEERLRNPCYSPRPRYWVKQSDVSAHLDNRWQRDWLFGWRNICRTTDLRTVIAAIFPKYAIPHSMNICLGFGEPADMALLCGVFGSFVLDYCARQKIGGTNMTHGYVRQFPVPPPSRFLCYPEWSPGTVLSEWILPRVVELTYTAWDLEAFGKDVGFEGPPFRWDPARRFVLRCELDAAFFHLYLPCDRHGDWLPASNETADDLSRLKASFPRPRHAVDYILDTFPIVRKNEEKAHGEYRTKRMILEVYDAMTEAMRTGEAYRTRVDPGPGDGGVRHEPRG